MHLSTRFILIFSIISYVSASVLCNSSSSCPEDLPCCSQYGECGVGSYCLGGCHPAFSHSIDSCMPMPVCKNFSSSFDSTDGLINSNDYLGDASDGEWIYNGYIDSYDDSLLLAMPNQSSGTVLSSTNYVWYGKISAYLKTSHLGGVITAFILFSNSQDEIDYEFVGNQLTVAETNFYYEAVLNYSNSISANVTDTYENYHLYEIDWTPDILTWTIDGKEVRTLEKADTYNESTESYHYPQTPSRVQISLWPGGDSKNGVGTIEWAGGSIDWDSEDIKEYGYYYMLLKNVSVECYSPPEDTLIDGDHSYMFNNSHSFNQEDVMITDEDTVLGSQKATGLDPDEGKDSSSSGASSSSTSSETDQSTKTESGDESTSTSGGRGNGGNKSTFSTSTAKATGFVQFGETSSSASADSQSSNDAIKFGKSSIVSLLISSLMFITALV